MASNDWENFIVRSQKERSSLGSSGEEILGEFFHLLNILGRNESSATLAFRICNEYPDYHVAGILDPYVR